MLACYIIQFYLISPDEIFNFMQVLFFFFSFIFISWRLIPLQYCSGFCDTLTWISHGFTFVPHSDPPSHLPPHPFPLHLYILWAKCRLLVYKAKVDAVAYYYYCQIYICLFINLIVYDTSSIIQMLLFLHIVYKNKSKYLKYLFFCF